MRTEVVGRDIEITEAIRAHAVSKVEHFAKHFDGVSSAIVTITKPSHSHKGEFDVEIITHVPKHDPFVCHAKGLDLYVAIDEAAQKADRQIIEYKKRLREGSR